MKKRIVLTTLNARYTHASIGLRYLHANLKEFEEDAVIREFVINENVQSLAEQILEFEPEIVGIGVYIWNASDVSELIDVIKKVAPETMVVLGGPEAGYVPHRCNFDAADYLIQGEGEVAFYELCRDLLNGVHPEHRLIKAPIVRLDEIELPYRLYNDNDVANRFIYVEASRGCPFLCEFCLSAIDEKVRYFQIEPLLDAFETLWQRGVRNFKFIDRTFNLNIKFANALMDFFLSKEPPYFAHFEVIPDHFPDSIKERITQFPPGSLQLEVGIQTLNPEIADNINRPLRIEKIKRNLDFLENETQAHMHLDLIVGLPGETLESFGRNLNELCSISRSEIQIGILKKLSGTTMSRHDALHGMVYSDKPPYDVLKTEKVTFQEIQQMKRFARFWDMTYNSGNFNRSIRLLWSEGNVFETFLAFSDWIYGKTASTYKISLDRIAALLFEYLTDVVKADADTVGKAMYEDLTKVGGRKIPQFLRPYENAISKERMELSGLTKRQQRHL
ncbi:MAG: DUF4080 domain-containing protein [Sulfurimonadaceae bacterium]|nr:DUF4080 domain-containing protein [Sulfurimonadaceae bacterium]